VFFVPYKQTTVSTQSGPSGIGTRTTLEDTGSMALDNFLKIRGEKLSERTGATFTTTLRADVYAFRIGAVILLAILDYLLFCCWLRREKHQAD
ncbi:MAG: hypothetical protein OEW05_14780, partial [Candidatus Aminicenantes bacterium]|nr:hypothetical protein [Candidatus Aminicenantes bacterium]